jgi:hypothetical protein
MRIAVYVRSVRSSLPEPALDFFDAALDGDPAAARQMIGAVPRRLRGHIAVIVYQLRVSNPAYREILGEVWRLDEAILTDFWNPSMIRRMLARADFQKPDCSGSVAAYRAANKASKRMERALSWYVDPAVALGLASRNCKSTSELKLLRVNVPWSDVIYWGESRGAMALVGRRSVDATPYSKDWRARQVPYRRTSGLWSPLAGEPSSPQALDAAGSWSVRPAATTELVRSAR